MGAQAGGRLVYRGDVAEIAPVHCGHGQRFDPTFPLLRREANLGDVELLKNVEDEEYVSVVGPVRDLPNHKQQHPRYSDRNTIPAECQLSGA